MAKAKKTEANNEEENSDNSQSVLSNILKQNKEEHFNYQETVTWKASTGSLLLDEATGGIHPGVWRFCGKNNSGKTPQALECLRNIFLEVPNSKGIWFPSEGRGLSEENKARCGIKFVYTPEEWDIGTIFVFETNIFELIINTIKTLVKNNPQKHIYAFVIDSVDGLQLRDDAAKEIDGNNRVAGVPMLSKKMFQSLSMGMFKFGHWMGLVSQVTSEIKLDPYSKSPDRGGNFSGGNSMLHASDVIINYETCFAGDFILDNPKGKMNDGKSKVIGQNVKVTMAKSIKETTRKKLVVYPIKYGRKPSGIWIEREIGDFIIAFDLVEVAGAGWITIAPNFLEELRAIDSTVPEKIQGFENFYKVFEDRPQLTASLKTKFQSMI
jgi:hypothetical protein